MAKYVNADDFLLGIVGGAADLEISGVGTIRVRAIDYMDLDRINREAQGNEIMAGFLMASAAIVEPQLTEEQLQLLQKARPGVIAAISKRVQELSGIREDMENLAGGGS